LDRPARRLGGFTSPRHQYGWTRWRSHRRGNCGNGCEIADEPLTKPARVAARIADSSSRNALSFSSTRTTKRFPSPRCASATKIVRPRESTVATQPQLQPALLRLSPMISQYSTRLIERARFVHRVACAVFAETALTNCSESETQPFDCFVGVLQYRTNFVRSTLPALVLPRSLHVKFAARFRKIFLRQALRRPLWRGRCPRIASLSCRSVIGRVGACHSRV
jgi:hypothetical protein